MEQNVSVASSQNSRSEWINVRMRKLLADDYCPQCGKHRVLHNDKACNMRFVSEEAELEAVNS